MANAITSLDSTGQYAIVTISVATTSAQLAQQFTGSANNAADIDTANGLDPGQPIPPGETISIPVADLSAGITAQISAQSPSGSSAVGLTGSVGGFTPLQIGIGIAAVFALFAAIQKK